jgi:uncharacterized protein YtpQ (UPF0354 family)
MKRSIKIAARVIAFAIAAEAAFSDPIGSKDSRIVMIVASRDFTDEEYYDTRLVFDQSHAEVKVYSLDGMAATSHNGRNLAVDGALTNIRLD